MINYSFVYGMMSESKKESLSLRNACKLGDLRGIRNALSKGADINAAEENDELRDKNQIPHPPLLLIVCSEKDRDFEEEAVHFLLSAGADSNQHDADGMTALAWAIVNQKSEKVVESLLQAGADVNYQQQSGWTIVERMVSVSRVNKYDW